MARILIVDDSIVMRKNLVTIFTEAGHEVVGQASNGKQAISMYTELSPDLVTMDISMPIMRGVDAVKEIVTINPNAKIVIISALNQKQMVFEALNNGAKHYIIKPIVPNKVLGVLNEVLKGDNEPESQERPIEREKPNFLPGFSIQNSNGKFIITFNENLSTKDFNGLETAVNGLVFITPLNVDFNFLRIEVLKNDIIEVLLRLANRIKEVGGNLEVITENQELKHKFK